MSEFPHQGVNYWIGASDISEEGTYAWINGEEWKFAPPWGAHQPGDQATPKGSTAHDREGQNCINLDADHMMHDKTCDEAFAYMCMSHKIQTGLGGQVEGYAGEHGGHCDAGLSYEIHRTIKIEDVKLSSQYISAFKPSAYLKTWAR